MTTSPVQDTSVVICTYTEERWQNLVAAVESIQQQTISPCEIIVVIDNNQSLLERARAHLPGITVIENREQQGLSGARNSGIAVARGRYIAFLDDDAIAAPDWLEQLCRYCANPKILGVGGIVLPLWVSKRPAWFPEEFYWVVGCSYQKMANAPTMVRNPFGGCACIRREVFETVGGFRNELGRMSTRPMGGEETELCIRAKQHWPERFFLCVSQAIIHHHIPPQRASWQYFRSRCYAEGLSKAAIAQYAGAKDSLASELTYMLHTLPHGAVQGVMVGLFRDDLTGFLRTGALVAGLMLTVAGYIVGMISRLAVQSKRGGANASFNFTPPLYGNHRERDFAKSLDKIELEKTCSLIKVVEPSVGKEN